ncbi:DUF4446 family protein [Candidatus Roizmanbacteria bacterium]|nr:DUF4446 family protein [Candidatus Roizmanbacteria bacterium]
MMNGGDPTSVIFFILIALWLASLSFFLFKTKAHYDKLIKRTDKKGLQELFDQLVDDLASTKEKVGNLLTRVKEQEEKGNTTIQKIGLVRFNPFADTGGEQSFIIGLFDNKENGLLLTSLSGRSGTRWYAKQVKRGKGLDFDLSKEEEEVIKKAKAFT